MAASTSVALTMALVAALILVSTMMVATTFGASAVASNRATRASAMAAGNTRQLLSSNDDDDDDDDDGGDDDDDDDDGAYAAHHAAAAAMAHGGACSPAAVAHAWVAAYNEARFEALDTMYTPDALSYVNGRLDPLTDGKPVSPSQNACVRRRGRVEVHVGDVTTSGSTLAAASGTLLVQRAMTGVAMVFELDAATCRIETTRLFMSTESEAYRQYASEFICPCFPLLEELGECFREEEPAPIDISNLFETCLRGLSTGDANAVAACFTDDARIVVNGERQPTEMFTDPAQLRAALLDGLSWQHTVEHTLSEGFTLHAVVAATATARASGETVDFYEYYVTKFTDAGLIAEIHVAEDSAAFQRLLQRVRGEAPTPQFWKSQAALASLPGFVAELGYPTDFTDFLNQEQTNFAVWLAPALADAAGNQCFSEVIVYDTEVIHTMPSAHVDFAHVSVQLGDARGRANDVRAVTDSLVFDELTGVLTSSNNGLGHAVVDLHLGVRVALGQISVSAAQQSYPTLFASVFTATGDLSPEYFRLRNELCALL